MFQRIKNKYATQLTVAYKLLHDSLFALLVFFVLALLAEGALPGIISSHFGLYKIAILVLLNVLAITGIGQFIQAPEKTNNKKIVWPLFFIGALLLFNSLLKLNIFLNIFILVTLFVTGYFLLKVFQEEKN